MSVSPPSEQMIEMAAGVLDELLQPQPDGEVAEVLEREGWLEHVARRMFAAASSTAATDGHTREDCLGIDTHAESQECPQHPDGEPDDHWATVLVDSESLEPREAADAELELLDEAGFHVERMWIRPGLTSPDERT
jgi:hypothetical protein